MALSEKEVQDFQETIYSFYETNGRELPWRETDDPYHILVSEIMLQQTPVDRVIPKYTAFITAFPDIPSLAKSSVAEVLAVWQGLGYNRRALSLRSLALIVVEKYQGKLPDHHLILVTLPGIGSYTASAILAFAFNIPSIFIETNIRTVYIHFFFKGHEKITDADIRPYLEKTIDVSNPRKWYNALMDYGTKLKTEGPNPSRRSAHHVTQSSFEGSDRQIRGRILKALLKTSLSEKELISRTQATKARAKKLIDALIVEGFLQKDDDSYSLM